MKRRLAISMGLLGVLMLLSGEPWLEWASEDERAAVQPVPVSGEGESLYLRLVEHCSEMPLAHGNVMLRGAGHVASTAVSGEDGLVRLAMAGNSVAPVLLRIDCAGHDTMRWWCRPSWLRGRETTTVRMVARSSLRTIRVQAVSRVAEKVMCHWNWHLPGPDLAPEGRRGRFEIAPGKPRKIPSPGGIPQGALLSLALCGQSTGWGGNLRCVVGEDATLSIPLEGVRILARVSDERGTARCGIEVTWVAPEECGRAEVFYDVSDELGRVELVLPKWYVDVSVARGRPLMVDLCDGRKVKPGVPLYATGERPADIVWRTEDVRE